MPFRNLEGFKCCNSCSTGTRNVCILEQKSRVTRLNLCAVALQVLPSSRRGLQSQSHSTFHFRPVWLMLHFIWTLNCFRRRRGGGKAASSTCCIHARKNNLHEGKVRQLRNAKPRDQQAAPRCPARYLLLGPTELLTPRQAEPSRAGGQRRRRTMPGQPELPQRRGEAGDRQLRFPEGF